MSQEEPSDRKSDPWPLWMAGHAQLKFDMTECSKTQIRLTGLILALTRRIYVYISAVYSTTNCMVLGSIAVSFICTFLRYIECFCWGKTSRILLKRHIKDGRFTTMTPLGMSRDVRCNRLGCHNCFSKSIHFELIYFISIWTLLNLLKARTFLRIRKINEFIDHPSQNLQIREVHSG